jgi:Lon protease-like protein
MAVRRLPLFVLPTVLLPGARLPLHVFEPRYRQMVARCLEFDRQFGLLYHDGDLGGHEVEAGQVGCVAEIQAFQPLPDGRSLLLAQGVERFQVDDAVASETLYAEAVVEEYGDEPEAPELLAQRRRRSIALFEGVVERLAGSREVLSELTPAREISFRLASHIEVDGPWRQGLLRSRRESERLARIDEVLAAVLETLEGRDD